jgi:hypothetical protein
MVIRSHIEELKSYSGTYSFFRLAGKVGTNFNFGVPCFVTSACFLARLPMAFGCADEIGVEGREDEPTIVSL